MKTRNVVFLGKWFRFVFTGDHWTLLNTNGWELLDRAVMREGNRRGSRQW